MSDTHSDSIQTYVYIWASNISPQSTAQRLTGLDLDIFISERGRVTSVYQKKDNGTDKITTNHIPPCCFSGRSPRRKNNLLGM